MKFAFALVITACAALTVWGQAPTLRIVTEVPNLPSELYYGNTKVKPLRLRPGTNTPITINDSDFFVNQQYVDFLGRFPDQGGFDFWTSQITACGANAACIDFMRANTSGAFFLSIEFQETGYLVYRMYKSAYGDADGSAIINNTPTAIKVPVIRRQEFLPDMNQIRNNVQVGIGNWQATLEANKAAFAADFVQRARFVTAYPTSLTPTDFVTQLFNKAGVSPSAQQQQDAINEFGGAGNTADVAARGRALRRIAENDTLKTNEKNQAFVLMQYFGYLRRDPNSGPDTDHSGWKFWLDKLNSHGGDFHSAEMVKAFIVAGEYVDRF
jgi:hypothetical protein